MKATKAIMLTGNDAGIHNLIARVHNSRINKDFKRRDAVVIINPETNQKILRYVMGGSSVKAMSRNAIAIDYDGFETLGIPYSKQPIDKELMVRKATTYEKYSIYMKHPDLGIQISVRLGLIGVFLGVLGFSLGILSLL